MGAKMTYNKDVGVNEDGTQKNQLGWGGGREVV